MSPGGSWIQLFSALVRGEWAPRITGSLEKPIWRATLQSQGHRPAPIGGAAALWLVRKDTRAPVVGEPVRGGHRTARALRTICMLGVILPPVLLGREKTAKEQPGEHRSSTRRAQHRSSSQCLLERAWSGHGTHADRARLAHWRAATKLAGCLTMLGSGS
jgi:hypothetical protein